MVRDSNINLNGSMSLVDRIIFHAIDNLNKRGDHTNPKRVKQNIHLFLEKLSGKFDVYLPKNSVGVDIGAGHGTLSEVLKPRRVYNLDTRPPENGYMPQIKGKAEELPFSDGELNFACMFYSLPHFDDPKKAIQEAHRVVNNGGYVVIMMEFLRYGGQDRLIGLNEKSMNGIIFGEQAQSENRYNYLSMDEFEGVIKRLSFQKILVQEFAPTRWFDVIFKSSKSLYVLQK